MEEIPLADVIQRERITEHRTPSVRHRGPNSAHTRASTRLNSTTRPRTRARRSTSARATDDGSASIGRQILPMVQNVRAIALSLPACHSRRRSGIEDTSTRAPGNPARSAPNASRTRFSNTGTGVIARSVPTHTS